MLLDLHEIDVIYIHLAAGDGRQDETERGKEGSHLK